MELILILLVGFVVLVIIKNNNKTDPAYAAIITSETEITRIENKIDNILESVYEASGDKWDYKIEDNLSYVQLLELGQKGWELVGISSYETGGGLSLNGIGSSRYKVQMRYAFKRKVIKNEKDDEVAALRQKLNELHLEKKHMELEIKNKSVSSKFVSLKNVDTSKNYSEILAEELKAKREKNN